MIFDEKKAKEYNAKYDGFEVRYADGYSKMFGKYGHAVRYVKNHLFGEPKIIGHTLDLDNLKVIETVLSV